MSFIDYEIGQDPWEYELPKCPSCGAECHTIYRDHKTGQLYGCNICVRSVDAYDDKEAWNR